MGLCYEVLFCLTGDLGLMESHTSQIANQPCKWGSIWGQTRITNIVMMGMGEPLHNYDNLCRPKEYA